MNESQLMFYFQRQATAWRRRHESLSHFSLLQSLVIITLLVWLLVKYEVL